MNVDNYGIINSIVSSVVERFNQKGMTLKVKQSDSVISIISVNTDPSGRFSDAVIREIRNISMRKIFKHLKSKLSNSISKFNSDSVSINDNGVIEIKVGD